MLHVRRDSTAFPLLAEWIIYVALLRDILGTGRGTFCLRTSYLSAVRHGQIWRKGIVGTRNKKSGCGSSREQRIAQYNMPDEQINVFGTASEQIQEVLEHSIDGWYRYTG